MAQFQFTPEFIKTGLEISPIRMLAKNAENIIYSFPALPKETFLRLPPVFADSLPDKFGNKILDAWLQKQGRTPEDMNPVERLCYTGKRGMGALEYEPVLGNINKSSSIDIDELTAVVAEILQERSNLQTSLGSPEMIKDIVLVGTSAGGARAKAVIAINDDTNEIRSGQADAPEGFTHWLLKFDGIDSKSTPQGYGRIEYAYYLMAKAAGVEMTECRLLERSSHAHFLTKRFDRYDGNAKHHMLSLCGMAHYDFNNPAAYSYEMAFQVMREMKLPYSDAERLFRRMVFNVKAYNRDDHTKNVAFLMNKKGYWKLSPAYDVTFAYDTANKWLARHQMSVNGKRESISDEDLLNVAKQMNIKKPQQIIFDVISAVSNWKKYAKEAGIEKAKADFIYEVIKH
ncbi:MAG: type II toxin-antitoxin system HipA family toxin [Geovibrio sp.]|nr:type II toxin-antitoxin system HipA family toxin [Geovibrio sp.]